MELSVCIPIYNVDVKHLVNTLLKQLQSAKIDFEILLIDDQSKEEIKAINQKTSQLSPRIKYEELPENIGRSRIRNLLARKSKGRFLLFLDCDVLIDNPEFIKTYIQYYNEFEAKGQEGLLVRGGYRYILTENEKKGRELRYRYGTEIEEAKLDEEGNVLLMPFLGGNFLVERMVFDHIQFDESIQKYGYEDLLFNMDHMAKFVGLNDQAINNPIKVGYVDTNEEFLSKTIEAMETLALLYTKKRIVFEDHLRILVAYHQLKSNGLLSITTKIASNSMPLLLYNLTSKTPSLKLFQLFKLLHFTDAMKRMASL